MKDGKEDISSGKAGILARLKSCLKCASCSLASLSFCFPLATNLFPLLQLNIPTRAYWLIGMAKKKKEAKDNSKTFD